MLTFIQLSDIHFRGSDDDEPNVLDYEHRQSLVADIRRVVEDDLQRISGLLICGDIADAGDPTQFSQALEWLQGLCADIGLDPWMVWVVPGNHDLDRDRIGDPQQAHRAAVRAEVGVAADAIFEGLLGDDEKAAELLEPFDNYLELASIYGCAFDAGALAWRESLSMGKFEVVLKGLASSLLCGRRDNTTDRRMIVGADQAHFVPEPGLLHYIMCHHPHNWLLDNKDHKRALRGAHVCVTGHEHRRGLTPSEGGIYLESGAVSPVRQPDGTYKQDEDPSYAIVALDVEEGDREGTPIAFFRMAARRRVWIGGAWTEDTRSDGELGRRTAVDGIAAPVEADVEPLGPADVLNRPKAELRYRLGVLTPDRRNRCAESIGHTAGEIMSVPSFRRTETIFRWAEDEGKLSALWNAATNKSDQNPF
jgi:predicted phosphodiesterase